MTPRRFQGQRALSIVVRTAHVASAGIVLGGVTLGVDPGRWLEVAFGTGMLLVGDDLYRYGAHWLRFLQSWAILVKVGLLGWGMAVPEALPVALWAAVVLGGLISHAPGAVRQHAFWGPPGPCAVRGTARAG